MKKRTIDINDGNDAVLEALKREKGIGYGTTINGLIQAVCRPDSKAKEELLEFIKQRLRILNRQMDAAAGYEAEKLMQTAQTYQELAKYLNDGIAIGIDEINAEPVMIKIQMKDRYLIVPDDWIVLNPEEAEQCENALVVEVRQGKRKKTIPHFIFFHNLERGVPFDATFCDMVSRKCVKKYPGFQEFIDFKNSHPDTRLKPDPEDPGHFLNEEDVLYGPQIGFFPVYVRGERILGKYGNYEPPYGVQIIITKED